MIKIKQSFDQIIFKINHFPLDAKFEIDMDKKRLANCNLLPGRLIFKIEVFEN